MTQPPGQQPPPGVFGAPYDPPPGPPQPPPAAYGGPPPGPYSQPTGPYAPQHGYGHPPQQLATGGPAGPGGSGGRLRSRTGRIIGVALVVLLVAGGGVWFATSGGDDGGKTAVGESAAPSTTGSPPHTDDDRGAGGDGGGTEDRKTVEKLNAGRKPGEAKVLWIQKGGVDLPPNGVDVYGPWIVGDTVVKAMYRSVTGYSVVDGKQKWSLRLPADVCAAPTRPTDDGRIVLGVMKSTASDAVCESLQMIDLTTGKAGWSKTYSRKGTWDLLSDVVMAINGDTVTVGRQSRTDAYRVSDGKELFAEQPGSCQPFGFVSGSVPIAATSCQTPEVDLERHQVQRIDPVTGKAVWTYEVKKGWQIAQFYSVSPLVVLLKKPDAWGVLMLNSNGTYRSQLASGTTEFELQCGSDVVAEGQNLDDCLGAAADDDTLYLASKPEPVGDGHTNKVAAFDLDTGKPKWEAAAPAGQIMLPMRVEDGELFMYVAASKGRSGGIASLPPAGGTPRVVLRHPASATLVERHFFTPWVVYENGRSILMQSRMSGTDESEMDVRALMSFGE